MRNDIQNFLFGGLIFIIILFFLSGCSEYVENLSTPSTTTEMFSTPTIVTEFVLSPSSTPTHTNTPKPTETASVTPTETNTVIPTRTPTPIYEICVFEGLLNVRTLPTLASSVKIVSDSPITYMQLNVGDCVEFSEYIAPTKDGELGWFRLKDSTNEYVADCCVVVTNVKPFITPVYTFETPTQEVNTSQ